MTSSRSLRLVVMLTAWFAWGAIAQTPAAATPAHSDKAAATDAAKPAAAAADASHGPDADDADDADDAAPHKRHHHGNDLISVGHGSHLALGQSADAVVSILGSSTSEGQARDVVSILGNTRVTGDVTDSAVAVLGSTYIDSAVAGDAVAVLGSVYLGPHADVGGDVVAVGGEVHRDPAATVHGEVQSLGTVDGRRSDWAGSAGIAEPHWLQAWIEHCVLYGRPLAAVAGLGWAWTLALVMLALYAGLALLFPAATSRSVRTLETHPGPAVLAALLTLLLTPILLVLLCVTLIGIAAVPFVVFGLFCAGLFGKAVVLAWLGGRCLDGRTRGPISHPAFAPAVAVLVGGAIVLLLYMIPVIGFLVYNLIGLVGLGTVVYALILADRERRSARIIRTRPFAAATAAAAGGPAAPGGASIPAGASVPGNGPAPGAAPTPDVAINVSAGASTDPGAAPYSEAAQAPGAAPAADPGVPPYVGPGAAPSGAAPAERSPFVTAALPRAGFWIRMGALFIDALLIGVLTHLLSHDSHLHLIVLAAYGAIMWKLRGSTVGGIVFDLQVVRLDGRAIEWHTAIVRALGCFLSLFVVGLGFFWIAFDDAKQAWHDKIAGTVVVRVPKGVAPP